MKKHTFLGIFFLLAFLSVTVLSGQEGFTGPGYSTNARRYRTVTVAEAKNLPDDTRVVLTGNIIQSLGDEKYSFKDATGDITIDIDRKIWRGLSIGIADTVEIAGKVEVKKNRVEIEVKNIRKM